MSARGDETAHNHGLRTSGEEITFTARPKIKSQSLIFKFGRSICCLPHRPKISDFFDLCLHLVSVVCGYNAQEVNVKGRRTQKLHSISYYTNKSILKLRSTFFCSLITIVIVCHDNFFTTDSKNEKSLLHICMKACSYCNLSPPTHG
jgi:hypothetical protein